MRVIICSSYVCDLDRLREGDLGDGCSSRCRDVGSSGAALLVCCLLLLLLHSGCQDLLSLLQKQLLLLR